MDPATGRGLPLTPGVAMLSFARTTRIVRIVRLLRLVRMCLDMIPWEKVISPPGLRNKDGKGKTKIYQQKEKRVAIISLRSMLVYLYGVMDSINGAKTTSRIIQVGQYGTIFIGN